jgi:hypothetical protein
MLELYLIYIFKVGGIPEVLPEGFIYFVEPDIASIEAGLVTAVWDVIHNRQPSKEECHSVVKNTYNWSLYLYFIS